MKRSRISGRREVLVDDRDLQQIHLGCYHDHVVGAYFHPVGYVNSQHTVTK